LKFFSPFFAIFEKFIKWVRLQLNEKQFLIFASILVGLTAGLAAVILKIFVFQIHRFVSFDFQLPFNLNSYLYLIFPLIGIVLTTFVVRRFFNQKLGRGTANIIRSIIKKSGFLPKDQMYSHVVTSALTVGLGGSAGLESPIVTTGSSIGSNFAKTYQLIYKDRVLLLACGAAAGIGAAFNAPIAGVLFALEVLLVDASISAFIPLIIAAASGALCSKIILGDSILLTFKLQEAFNYYNVPFYALLGILTGFVSIYYSRMFAHVEKRMNRQKNWTYRKAVQGGILLAILILVLPPLFGEGYESIKTLSNNSPEKLLDTSIFKSLKNNEGFVLLFVGLVMFLKVIAASLTISSGGNGGNFAPSLFVGAYVGYLFARIINFTGITSLPISNFTLVAMSGVLTGIFHAPMTGIFLIAEITGGYELMIPLMLVSAISYVVVKRIEPLSMDAKKLASKGQVLRTNKDMTILSSLKAERMIETDFETIRPTASLREITEIIAHSKRSIFPVLTSQNQLVGIIQLDQIRELIFQTALYDAYTAQQLMIKSPARVDSTESMHAIMKKFDESNAWILPVISEDQFVGFISKSNLLANYRAELIRTSVRE
jgi:CIC family chloride channel protein